MTTNLLPAILLAGPPHSGKSVLAYHLSRRLREAQVAHILLRAAPDGEGDWFYESPEEVRMRQRQKGSYTGPLIEALQQAISRRHLPMLVDIGGRPREIQFRLLDACTHVIHLWREEDDRQTWARWLEERGLIPIASLRSRLVPPDHLELTQGSLSGTITGLERAGPRLGPAFGAVLERVTGICAYPPGALEAEHLRQAPTDAAVITVAELAHDLGLATAGEEVWWEPTHLARLRELLPPGEPVALYGRGPAWLYAAVAIHAAPAAFHLFDARFHGWMTPPEVRSSARDRCRNGEFTLTVEEDDEQIRLRFIRHQKYYLIRPARVYVPPLPADRGVLLDGPMPFWLVTALARALRHHPRLAIYEPRTQRGVTFWEHGALPARPGAPEPQTSAGERG
ncbi:MAG: CRISPR-associated protein Csx3 [Anaerolineae bacterium]